jgi:hypothetical protein
MSAGGDLLKTGAGDKNFYHVSRGELYPESLRGHLAGLGRLDKPHPELERLQGDLVDDFPTVIIAPDGRPSSRNFPVMILNNSCDLPNGRLSFVTAVPIVDFGKYLETERSRRGPESLAGYAEAIRKNNRTELPYLPPFGGF